MSAQGKSFILSGAVRNLFACASMAWKRSSVRTRPGPPNILNELRIFGLRFSVPAVPDSCHKEVAGPQSRSVDWAPLLPFSIFTGLALPARRRLDSHDVSWRYAAVRAEGLLFPADGRLKPVNPIWRLKRVGLLARERNSAIRNRPRC